MDEELKRLFSDLNLVEYIALLENKNEKMVETQEHNGKEPHHIHHEEEHVSILPPILQPVVQKFHLEESKELKNIEPTVVYEEEKKSGSLARQFFCLLAFFGFGFAGGILYERAYMPLPIAKNQNPQDAISQHQSVNKELSEKSDSF